MHVPALLAHSILNRVYSQLPGQPLFNAYLQDQAKRHAPQWPLPIISAGIRKAIYSERARARAQARR